MLKTIDDKDWKGISYLAGFFILIAFVIGGLALALKLSNVVSLQMTGLSFESLRETAAHPAKNNAIRIAQSLTSIFGFLVPTIAVAFLLHRRPFQLLGFQPTGIRASSAGLVILIIGCSLLVSGSLSYFTNELPLPGSWRAYFDKLEEEYNRQVSLIISLKNAKEYVLALIIMAFLPALCEEALFRGGLQNFLTRSTGRPWLSIFIVSLLFSLVHFSGYGFLSRLFLGMVLGVIFHFSGKLWLSILAHFINNALAVTFFYFYIRQGQSLEDAMKQDPASFWGIVALPAVLILFVAFRRSLTPAHLQNT